MQRWISFMLGSALIMGGCNKAEDNSTALIEAKTLNRPIVAVVPMIDHSRNDMNWDVCQELHQSVKHRLGQKNRLYLVGEASFELLSNKALTQHNPFEADTSWIRRAYPQNEFVVFTELMNHHEIPIASSETSLELPADLPAELQLSARICVFDLRSKTPRVVLQEVVEQSHHIPKQFTKANFSQVPWGHETFDVSPLGIAHESFCKELADRVEDYILHSGGEG